MKFKSFFASLFLFCAAFSLNAETILRHRAVPSVTLAGSVQWVPAEFCSAGSAFGYAGSISDPNTNPYAGTIVVTPTNDNPPRFIVWSKQFVDFFLMPQGLSFQVFPDVSYAGSQFYVSSPQFYEPNRGTFRLHATGEEIVWIQQTPYPCP